MWYWYNWVYLGIFLMPERRLFFLWRFSYFLEVEYSPQMHEFFIPPTWSSPFMLSSTPFSLNYSASTRRISISVIFTQKKKKSTTWQAWALWKEADISVILPSKKFSRYLQCYLFYLLPFYLFAYSYFLVLSGWLAKSTSSVPH